jgi:hypothetical protein
MGLNLISTEAIVRITKPHSYRVYIYMLGPSCIEICRNARFDRYEDSCWDPELISRMSESEKLINDGKQKLYCEKSEQVRINNLKEIDLIYERLLKVWRPGNSNIVSIDGKEIN